MPTIGALSLRRQCVSWRRQTSSARNQLTCDSSPKSKVATAIICQEAALAGCLRFTEADVMQPRPQDVAVQPSL